MENQELTSQPSAPPAPEAAVETATDLTRRDFIKVSAAATAVAGAATFGALGTNYAWAQGAGRIKIGWIGCGGRGNGAVRQSLDAAPEMLLWAVGDIFDKAGGNRNGVKNEAKYKDKVDCPDTRCFQGFDAYKNVIDSGVDMIVQATPPGFRPLHIAYAIQQGKHVFAVKPFAVDAGTRLLFPVLRNAALLPLLEIASRSHDFAERARRGQLAAAELQDATFSITNLAAFGIDAFAPAINAPECAILGIGRITRQPVEVGETVAFRSVITLSLSFDPRAFDTAPAARFLQTLTRLIESPLSSLLF